MGQAWFTWADFRAIVRGLQLDRSSQLARAVAGPDLDWTLEAHLLAAVFDAVNIVDYRLRWLGGAKPLGDPPEPLPRPGIKSKTQQWTGKPRTIEEMDKLLGWRQN